ncbi:MAG: glycosyltransferase family 4 protein [Phycisphaerae bacterium]|nr:glycosyltransferase family 4 protein [Phycisphaerae bacterium]
MKITFILPGIDISGGVKSTLELANRLYKRGHQVNVIYSVTPWQLEHKNRDFRTKIKYILSYLKGRFASEHIKWFDLKANLIQAPSLKEKYIPDGDVIIATWWGNVYDVNSYKSDKGEKFHFIRSYETWCGPEYLVDRCYSLPLHKIAVSSYLKKLIETKFKVPVFGPLENGLDFEVFYKEKQGFECNTPKRVGLMYRRDTVKGAKDGLITLIKVQKRMLDIQIVLFGEPPTIEDEKLIKNLKNVEFHELPYGENLRNIYSSLDIFLFSSHFEGFAAPSMEAMACGVACVLTEVGAFEDVTIPGKTALTSPPKKTEELYNNLLKLLSDEQMRKQIAEQGYNYVQKFTWDKTVTTLENVFFEHLKIKNVK